MQQTEKRARTTYSPTQTVARKLNWLSSFEQNPEGFQHKGVEECKLKSTISFLSQSILIFALLLCIKYFVYFLLKILTKASLSSSKTSRKEKKKSPTKVLVIFSKLSDKERKFVQPPSPSLFFPWDLVSKFIFHNKKTITLRQETSSEYISESF